MTPLRACPSCGAPRRGNTCRCGWRATANRRRPGYTAAETRRRAQTVQAHIATHGYTCPGWKRPPHPATDLTADHITPIAAGGPENGPLTVLCRTCNASKGRA